MKWAEFRVHTTQEAVEPVSNILHELGAAGVAIEDPQDLVTEWSVKYGEVYELSPEDYPDEGVMVKAYFPMGATFKETIAEVRRRVHNLVSFQIDIGHGTMDYTEVKEEDWATAWKSFYHPVQVTEQVTIVPTWEEYSARPGEIIIELDPGMAFGTGTHPTTILSLQALEHAVKQGDAVIDVGTGSGILAIAAWKFGAEGITALDLDEVAVNSAKANVALNGASDFVDVQQGNLLDGVASESADVLVSNILAEVILQFTTDAYRIVKRGGLFLTSGIISSKREAVEGALKAAGFAIQEVNELDDWVAIVAQKPSQA